MILADYHADVLTYDTLIETYRGRNTHVIVRLDEY